MPYRYTQRLTRAVLVGFFGLCTLLEIPSIFNPGKGGLGLRVLSVGFLGVLLLLTIRGLGSCTVEATVRGVRYRNLARDRRWRWEDIDQFEVREVRVGVMGYRRRVLFVHEVKGTNRKLEAVNARPSTSPNPIDDGRGPIERFSAGDAERDGFRMTTTTSLMRDPAVRDLGRNCRAVGCYRPRRLTCELVSEPTSYGCVRGPPPLRCAVGGANMRCHIAPKSAKLPNASA